MAFAHDDEQHDMFAVRRALRDRNGLLDFRHVFEPAVDFGGADANAVDVEGCVRAAVDDRTAFRRDFGPVAVTPESGIGREILLTDAVSCRVAPELQRY